MSPDSPSRFFPTAVGGTSVGRVRDHNEDRMLLAPELDLFGVADGMGGHNAGEVASTLAALSLKDCFAVSLHAPLPAELVGPDDGALPHDARRLVAAVRKANGDVHEISRTHRQHRGMGTTVVAVHVARKHEQIHIAHVGDSRCYRIREGGIEQLTGDHSLVGDALRWNPNLTKAELARLPQNVISRAVGRGATVDVDLRTEALRAGDVYLLCSDGLSGMVEDDDILSHVAGAPSLDAACKALLDAANAGGGEDNVTVVLVRIDQAP